MPFLERGPKSIDSEQLLGVIRNVQLSVLHFPALSELWPDQCFCCWGISGGQLISVPVEWLAESVRDNASQNGFRECAAVLKVR